MVLEVRWACFSYGECNSEINVLNTREERDRERDYN